MKYLGKSKYDSVLLGTALGLLSPIAIFMIYYIIRYRGMYFPAFLRYLYSGGTFIPILSLCVTPNLLIFFIFIWTKRDKSAKGVLMATFVYALYVCVMKTMGA
jgi:hypothetical protein